MASRRSLRSAMVRVSIRLAVGGRESRGNPERALFIPFRGPARSPSVGVRAGDRELNSPGTRGDGQEAGSAGGGPTGFGPTGLGPTGLGPTGLGPTGLGPTGLGPTGLGRAPPYLRS